MSLYDDLGVADDADADAIRKAHRRGVRAHHPDTGGDREEFEKVQRAYLILRDPKTRARYDETGEEDVAPDNELAEIATLIVGCFDEATAACRGQFDRVDLVSQMRAGLAQRLANAKAGLDELKAAVAAIEGIAKRLSYGGDGSDVLGSMLTARLADNQRAQAAVADEVAKIQRAQAYAEDYGYVFRPIDPSAPWLQGWDMQAFR